MFVFCLHVCLFFIVYLFVVVCEDVEGALSKALLVGNFEAAVDICIADDRMVRMLYSVLFTYTISLYLCLSHPPLSLSLSHTHTHTQG